MIAPSWIYTLHSERWQREKVSKQQRTNNEALDRDVKAPTQAAQRVHMQFYTHNSNRIDMFYKWSQFCFRSHNDCQVAVMSEGGQTLCQCMDEENQWAQSGAVLMRLLCAAYSQRKRFRSVIVVCFHVFFFLFFTSERKWLQSAAFFKLFDVALLGEKKTQTFQSKRSN